MWSWQILGVMSKLQLFWQVVGTLCKRADVTFLTTFVTALLVVRQTTSSIYQQNYNLSLNQLLRQSADKRKEFPDCACSLNRSGPKRNNAGFNIEVNHWIFSSFSFSKYFPSLPPFSSFSFSVLIFLCNKIFSFTNYFPPVPSLPFFSSPNKKKSFNKCFPIFLLCQKYIFPSPNVFLLFLLYSSSPQRF